MRLEILAHTGRTTVEVVHVSAQNTGRAGLANKGGIVAELLVNGRTRLSFLTAHLEAHEGASKYQTRVSTMADILAGTKQQQHDCSQTAHYSFVMGDLNFRTELPNHAELDEEEHKGIVGDFVERKDWDSLNKIDELQRALKNKDCLVGYRTLFCNFPPTFKLERQSGYKYNDKRRPSYTDRILWKTNEGLENALYPLVYEPIDEFTSSDHKPVRAAFAVDLVHPFLLRPRLARRRSALNVSRILSKKKSKLLDVSRNERLHLFLTDISCEIFTKGKGTRASDRSVMMPNPYISLVSDPPEALQQPVKQGWKKVRQDVWKSIAVWSNPRPSAKNLTSKGFPRSSTKKQTVSTKWDKEEIHTEVTTHYNDGSPIDLSGALLQITVMDSRNPAFDTLIGSTATNLANLIQSCQSPIATNKLRKKRLRSTRSRPNRRMSLMQVFGRRSGADRSSIRDVDDLEEEHIRSIEIDEALVKNGVETGRIKLKLETMWMDETTRKAFNGLQSSSAFFPSQRMTANASSDTADQECGQRRGGHVLR